MIKVAFRNPEREKDGKRTCRHAVTQAVMGYKHTRKRRIEELKRT